MCVCVCESWVMMLVYLLLCLAPAADRADSGLSTMHNFIIICWLRLKHDSMATKDYSCVQCSKNTRNNTMHTHR